MIGKAWHISIKLWLARQSLGECVQCWNVIATTIMFSWWVILNQNSSENTYDAVCFIEYFRNGITWFSFILETNTITEVPLVIRHLSNISWSFWGHHHIFIVMVKYQYHMEICAFPKEHKLWEGWWLVPRWNTWKAVSDVHVGSFFTQKIRRPCRNIRKIHIRSIASSIRFLWVTINHQVIWVCESYSSINCSAISEHWTNKIWTGGQQSKI